MLESAPAAPARAFAYENETAKLFPSATTGILIVPFSASDVPTLKTIVTVAPLLDKVQPATVGKAPIVRVTGVLPFRIEIVVFVVTAVCILPSLSVETIYEFLEADTVYPSVPGFPSEPSCPFFDFAHLKDIVYVFPSMMIGIGIVPLSASVVVLVATT